MLTAVCCLIAATLHAEQRFEGQTESGAFYTILAPDTWQPADGLVIYNHGFDIDQVEPDPDLGVLSEFVLAQGFAVAASSYSLNGWALFQTTEDNQQLYRQVVAQLGEPDQVIVFGGSLGGLVTLQAVEQGGIGNVVGAYPVCAPLHGSDAWNQALDLRLIYDAACDGVSGGELPGGSEGLPFALDPDQYDGVLGDITAGLVAAAVERCTGFSLPAALRSSGQNQRYEKIRQVSGISEAFLPINMAYATFVLSDMVRDPDKLNSRAALGNFGVDYGDPDINDRIERVTADPFARLDFRLNYTPTGRVGQTRVLATHTDGDGLVVVEHLHSFARRAPADRFSYAVVREAEPSHCGYSEAEVVAGWEALLDWIDTDQQPSAGDIQTRCQSIEAAGRYQGPCRYDPDFQPAPFDQRVRPRTTPEQRVTGDISGSWFDPDSSGQGWFLQVLADGQAVAYWFTYDASGQPAWIGGIGHTLGNALVFDQAFITGGARFGDAFSSADVTLQDWGSLRYLFSQADAGQMAYRARAESGEVRLPAARLTKLGDAQCASSTLDPVHSGLWYAEDRSGEGFVLEVQNDGRVFLAWFTYTPDGGQTWLYGEADRVESDGFSVPMEQFSGPRFGPGYDARQLQRTNWGRVSFSFVSADQAGMTWQSDLPGYDSGGYNVTRLSRPLTGGNCP
ncbi:MAG: hypothetical protein QNJ40_11925 [Xanthomonadales bacterium]|nr:hypothetical protein [Xanthomonadales bacterium]